MRKMRMMERCKIVWLIFLSFMKIGPVTFGGGYAMIPLIEKEVVERRKWVKTKDIADIFAISESVPGAIAINSATFIGYRLGGVPGAIAAMVGVMLPTFIIVILLSVFFLQVQDHPKIEAAFVSIKATIVALITYAAIKIGKTAIIDRTTLVLTIAAFALMFFTPIHPVLIIVGGGIAGIAIVLLRTRMGLNTKLDHSEGAKAQAEGNRNASTDSKERDAGRDVERFNFPGYFYGDGI